jgi:hypothetical protein
VGGMGIGVAVGVAVGEGAAWVGVSPTVGVAGSVTLVAVAAGCALVWLPPQAANSSIAPTLRRASKVNILRFDTGMVLFSLIVTFN